MPSSTDHATQPALDRDVLRRYRWVQRLSRIGIALLLGVVAGALSTVVSTGLVLLSVLLLAVALLIPVFGTAGGVELRTDADPAAVRDAFTGARPPPLAPQWGLADEVRTAESGAVYEFSALLGLQTYEMVVESRAVDGGDHADALSLTVTLDDGDWATYEVETTPTDDGSRVRIEWESHRRFGLRQLPVRWAAKRYRDRLLASQGYVVVDRWDRGWV
ncbi:hypothetical protein [Haloglomus litoreum]|uniref:hypothetical protein n=1 Tax=Haloglomus litoreum TaxID=3034026 RepID=UPI0023E83001|nr:hypothetical protein [Haloglomus sp. DT116]